MEINIENVHSSYRKYTHMKLNLRVDIQSFTNKNKIAQYMQNRRSKFFQISKEQQLKNYGYWVMTTKAMYPNCYFMKRT